VESQKENQNVSVNNMLVFHDFIANVVTEYTKVIAIGGYNSGKLKSTELVDVSGEAKVCPQVPDFPYEVNQLSATFYKGKVLACGGISDTYEDKCYSLGFDLSKWEELDVRLLSKRARMSSSIIDNKWLISGGHDGDNILKSTIVYDGTKFLPGPDMLRAKERHCQLTINTTHVFFTGGDENEAFLLDWGTGNYIPLDDMPEYASGACGVLNNKDHGLEVLVTENRHSFIFSFENLKWREGPIIPEELGRLDSAPTENGFVSVGGYYPNVYVPSIHEFNEVSYEWIANVAQLQTGRELTAAAAVPNNFANCE